MQEVLIGIVSQVNTFTSFVCNIVATLLSDITVNIPF